MQLTILKLNIQYGAWLITLQSKPMVVLLFNKHIKVYLHMMGKCEDKFLCF